MTDSINATVIRDMVFECIKAAGHDGLTDEQVQDKLKLQGNTERPRRCELVKQGKIRKSGTRKARSGRTAAVWVANAVPMPPAPVVKADKPTWTSQYPIAAGRYWFYGSPFREDGPSRLSMVDVRTSAAQRILVCDGNFMYEHTSRGVFMPADVPELPTPKELDS
jgi:hypothetical protein